MAPPPIYNDLGKMARDLFRRGYHPGLWQLDCKTMTSSGLEFFTTGFASQDASKVMGSLQSKYNMEDYGLTLTERWNTDNLLYGEIAQKDKLAEGLLLALEGRFQPSSGDKEGAFMARFSQDNYHLMGKISIKSEPVLALSAVMGHKEFLGGVACDYDIDGGKVSWKLALGWLHEATTLHGELIDAKGWLVSLFHKANDQIDVGFEIAKSGAAPPPPEDELVEGERPSYRRRSDLNVSLGMIYHLEGDALIRAKINNKVELGLGYEQKLREGVTISVSTVLEGKNISDGNHKFGVGLSLQC